MSTQIREEGRIVTEGVMVKVKVLSLTHYVDEALKQAEYYRDEHGVVVAKVPAASGFFAQGDSFEDARGELKRCYRRECPSCTSVQLGFEIGISREEWLRL